MALSIWILFSCFTLIATVSPGPAVLLSVTNSLTYGIKKSVFSSLGNVIGLLAVSSSAALGLGAVLQTSHLLFTLLKISGAIYLMYLGIKQWRAKKVFLADPVECSATVQGNFKLFFQGLIVAIANPKAVLFFTAIFPQFLDPSKPIVPQFFILTITFMIFSFASLVIYAIGARFAAQVLINGDGSQFINRISGTIFFAFGLGLLRLKNNHA